MMSSLVKKVCVITGSSSGIGAASAVELAKCGARIMLHGRNEAALQKVSDQCISHGLSKEDVSYVLGDVHDDATLTKIKDATLETFGRIDVLFNNAGYLHNMDGPIHRGGQVQALDDLYKINIRVPYLLIQEFIPALTESKGVIINCSSRYSTVPDPAVTGYSVTKAGLDQLNKVLALSLGMRGIRVNSINPGIVPTEIFNRRFGDNFNDENMAQLAHLSPLEHKLATPESIARIVAFLASDGASAMTGDSVVCDMGSGFVHPIMDLQ